jgi:hypothetical protein
VRVSQGEPFRKPPLEARQYLLTLILFGMGVWFAWDGWFNPEIESVWFNRLLAPVLLAWAVWDGRRMRRREIEEARQRQERERTAPSLPPPG